jgi:hypothetical protein
MSEEKNVKKMQFICTLQANHYFSYMLRSITMHENKNTHFYVAAVQFQVQSNFLIEKLNTFQHIICDSSVSVKNVSSRSRVNRKTVRTHIYLTYMK